MQAYVDISNPGSMANVNLGILIFETYVDDELFERKSLSLSFVHPSGTIRHQTDAITLPRGEITLKA